MEGRGKKQNRKQTIGEHSYLNRNCLLVKNLNYAPYRRCKFCEFKFGHCLFLKYQIISLFFIALSFSLFLFIENRISVLTIITIFAVVIIYGYFFNNSTEKIVEVSFAQRKAKEALEELSEKLEEKVEYQTRHLSEKNLHLQKLTKELRVANLRLEELDRQKTEFLSIASHQLRTPLSVLKGFTELIRDGAYGKPTTGIVGATKEIDESNEHLVKLVDEFLDISRIEQGRIKFNFSNCNFCEIADTTVHELIEKATQKGLEIRWSCPRDKKDVYCDREKIYNVIVNFVDNAIKYSKHGAIEITLTQEENGMAMRVKDNGIGFEKIDEVNLFQKFYRGENVKSTNVNGTGLGLYVCRKFIEAHGGRIWAHSHGLGKGSEFGFWVPLKVSSPLAEKL